MDMLELMRRRHSVRRYTDKPLDSEAVKALTEEMKDCNAESGLLFQLVTDEPEAFAAGKPSYGAFKGCRNYLVLVGKPGLEEAVGWYGERVVLKAMEWGIHSCWVALTYKKGKAKGEIPKGFKRYMVIALGYGETEGVPHKGKSITDISDYKEGDPDWYRDGLEAALSAPTAVNQQKFRFERDGETAKASVSGFGFYTKVDLGIVKYHFAAVAGKEHLAQ